MTHDRLQFECFSWMWNEHQELRRLFWCTFNDIKQVEKITKNIGNKTRQIILSNMKSLGMVKGVLDFVFFYKGALHVIDFKVGGDKLSPEQKDHSTKVKQQGGQAYECSTLEDFQKIINNIVL